MQQPYEINITEVSVPVTISKIQMTLSPFVLNATESEVVVTFMTADRKFVDRKTVKIPPDIYAGWGQDDDYIVDYVLGQLKMTRLAIS